jgi:hypothetical protein
MKKVCLLLALVLAAAAAAYPASANAPAQHFTEDVTGDVFVCESAVYTVTSGVIAITIHEGSSASGNLNFTVTIVPRRVVLEDAEGNVYSLHGAVWFGGTLNANTGGEQFTDTEKLQIVSVGGGTVDSVNVTFHITAQPNNIVVKDFDFGSCELPE